MGCTHASSCPLFPRLQQSLAGWRNAYCDADDAWLQCARYQTGLKGQPVPLALLPNGKVLGVLVDETQRRTERVTVASFAVADASKASGGGVAVLDDEAAETVLEEARTSPGGLFGRLRGLFRGRK